MADMYLSQQAKPGKYETLYLNIFWIGMLLYTLGSIFSETSFLNIILCQLAQSLGVVLMIPSVGLLIKPKIDSGYLRIIFILYFGWLITIIFRGHFSFDYNSLKDFLFGAPNGGLIYLVPLIVLFPRNFYYYNKLFDIIGIAAILFFILCIGFIKKLITSADDVVSQAIIENIFDLAIPSAFILLTYLYHSNKRNLIGVGCIAITLFFSVVRARRGLIFITSSLIFYSLLFYFFHSKNQLRMIYFLLLFLCLAAVYSNSFYKAKGNKLISFLYERGNEDTRTQVEILFYDDMKPNDWIVGRGITGEYFAPNIQQNQPTNYRAGIETGYLNLILKGGIISLVLLLLITIPAVIKGIFFSKNILSKAAGIWIFQFILNLYPQNSVSFNISYLMVWISVGICYSKEIRSLPNSYIKSALYNYNPL